MNFKTSVARIKEALHLKFDYEVGDLLGLKNTAFSDRLKRNSIPMEKLENLCLKEGLSLDWVLTGEGSPIDQSPPLPVIQQSRAKWHVVRPVDEETEILKPVLIPKNEGEDYVWYQMKTNDFVPVAEKGDLVIINTEIDRKNLNPNATYAIRIGSSDIVLAYAQRGADETTHLIPYDPTLEPMSAESCKIVGVVTELRRQFRKP